ncbi:MAG: hypothetical protein M1836_001123 [Candelina mexicana]|nr:MAG: hypothetical protein M1836_001123 [Candelina mexicana]
MSDSEVLPPETPLVRTLRHHLDLANIADGKDLLAQTPAFRIKVFIVARPIHGVILHRYHSLFRFGWADTWFTKEGFGATRKSVVKPEIIVLGPAFTLTKDLEPDVADGLKFIPVVQGLYVRAAIKLVVSYIREEPSASIWHEALNRLSTVFTGAVRKNVVWKIGAGESISLGQVNSVEKLQEINTVEKAVKFLC